MTSPTESEPTMFTFNPATAVRELLVTTSLVDPDEIADIVFQQTPEAAWPSLYRAMLRDLVCDVMRATRSPNAPTFAPAGKSRMRAAAQQLGYCDTRIWARGTWKSLGDCTREDILDLVTQRTNAANWNLAKAAEWAQLADRMAAAGVTTVRQLEAIAA